MSGEIEGWLSKELMPTKGIIKDVIFFGDLWGELVNRTFTNPRCKTPNHEKGFFTNMRINRAKTLLSFFILLLLSPLFISGCAPRKSKTVIDRVYELDPFGRLFVHPELLKHPPSTIAVDPREPAPPGPVLA
ncbi:MAG: hypothetical protein JRH08_02620 [Deltaproteobacteria bacterium]|nr:hypothetical protein [Deltaproteobacteria bacterium]